MFLYPVRLLDRSIVRFRLPSIAQKAIKEIIKWGHLMFRNITPSPPKAFYFHLLIVSFNQKESSNHQFLLLDSHNNHPLRNPVTRNPITFAQIGNEWEAMITIAPVMILKRCNMATMPKMQPATRRAMFFDFIIKYY